MVKPKECTSVLLLTCAIAVTASACSTDTEPVSTTADESTRIVEHARGTAEISTSPLRVVTLEPVELDTSVALGVIPVGTAVLSEAAGVPSYLGSEAAAIETVGTVPEPRIESIAALQPDLILGTETRHADYYEQLAAIAPTVFMASQSDPWQDNVRLVGSALGREDRAEELLDEYENRCDEIAEKYDTQGKTAQLIRPRADVFTLYGPLSFAGSTLECAGFDTPARPEWDEEISVDLSPELVGEARADLVVVTTTNPADPSAIPASITANATLLPNPYAVDQSFWITGVGPMGGQTVLDDIDRILAGGALTESEASTG
ncbi:MULTISPECIES: ABC transporter substrate-binding protein [Nocardiaceae]|uniref:ABC transporter substrate-binding protein n=1 Tax=Nocardiaceae TaxID=85025 RepID=UPI001E5EEBC7|nr:MULTISPECIES: iron-siderophore ABC transporter substrate-binding protein [Rhodococcus]MCC8926636.1 iron-siderophore ABC transporter substrate-binding protein [Rhodococcus sp. I2R]MCZ4274944.1 iron-siderophore ABC transporter substrate-binding protein [Rhodococcus yunnanensis]